MINNQTETPRPEDHPSITVLLVDDQRFIGLALQRLLSPAPEIVFHHCVDANRAIAHANEVRPDVILQDLVMDGIDGLTLVGEFRRNALTAATPIVMLSGNDDALSRTGAAKAGADDYLVKLPASAVLTACLRRHAAAARAADLERVTSAPRAESRE